MEIIHPLFVLIVSAVHISWSFNVEITEKGYIRPQFIHQNPSKLKDTGPNEFIPKNFANTMKIVSQENDKFSLILTSPRSTNPQNMTSTIPDSRGSIQHCPLGAEVFSKNITNCSTHHPNYTVPGDGFAIAAPVREDGSMRACSTVRTQKCSTIWYVPGYCYESSDFGQTWTEDKRTQMLSCPPLNTVEVLFVIDGSTSVGEKNFEIVKNWIKKIVRELDIEEGQISAGVVQYSHYNPRLSLNRQRYIKTEIKIGKYEKYNLFAAGVNRIRLQSYTTYTGQALRKVVNDFKNTKNYGEKNNKQIMILLTDGRYYHIFSSI
uniref:collagen alpha-1(VI) chain-like n=1 Tax=Styela clava TaxID=7725 RepID=UPI001939476F|nr:collagen alpha-1(VI) chain-like [Styela clava]